MSIEIKQQECCDHYNAQCLPVKKAQLVTISKGIYEGVNPVEGVRYPSPEHMSGWWLTTDEYDGNIDSLVTVHFQHIIEKRPELALYMALPFGYRFNLGGESEHVWFDQEVAQDSI
ncbi:immunity protein Imm33 domain-containing protein [Colwellia sp. MB02u-11]|uniref:immunity protein Imm33 domain-containing protein n=1 Tax=unclassified Colwellia TaxID=196834 RepID=UPI0015F6A0B7|nr:hypothetical protein [Colwellia sp. MB02u-11]MBA6234511.1 hypothetical protein [Colwellia sp. MB02u-7]MBA6238322.1 hypothetical protein [Colwellia sp. MB02u-11]MBA6301073.1 hypothetical protein [Colwellia sp. MB3u-22]MBA6312614.1 hypothetical protein [Colwellia sp. MB3u-64]